MKQSLDSELPLKSLFGRFEAMCKRQGSPIQATLRPAIHKLLAAELWANYRAFRFEPKELVSVTLYQGDVTDIARDKSLDLWQRAVKRATLSYPTDPHGEIRRIQESFASITEDAEFADFRDSLHILKRATIDHSKEPRAYLPKVRKDMAALMQDQKFADFLDTPGIFTTAVIGHPKNPRAFLQKVRETTAALAEEKEFAHFRNSPSLSRSAAVSSSDPRAFLRQVKRDQDALTREEEFAMFRDTPDVFLLAARGYSNDPREFLRKLKEDRSASLRSSSQATTDVPSGVRSR